MHQIRLLKSAATVCVPDPNRASRNSLKATFREHVPGASGDVVAVVVQHKRIDADDRWAYCLAVTDNVVEVKA